MSDSDVPEETSESASPLWPILVETDHTLPMYPSHKAWVRDRARALGPRGHVNIIISNLSGKYLQAEFIGYLKPEDFKDAVKALKDFNFKYLAYCERWLLTSATDDTLQSLKTELEGLGVDTRVEVCYVPPLVEPVNEKDEFLCVDCKQPITDGTRILWKGTERICKSCQDTRLKAYRENTPLMR